ncbi:26S proteasome subunit rpt4, partial [Coemansia sp. RSA 2681]
MDPDRVRVLTAYRRTIVDHSEWDEKVKEARLGVKRLETDYEKSEDDLKALQSAGQIIGEVFKQLDEDRFIVKASTGPRYVVGCRKK